MMDDETTEVGTKHFRFRFKTVGEATRIVATVFVAASISFGAAAGFTVYQVNQSDQLDEVQTCQHRVDDRVAQLTALRAVARAGSQYAKAGEAVLRVHPCPRFADDVHGDDAFTVGLNLPEEDRRSR